MFAHLTLPQHNVTQAAEFYHAMFGWKVLRAPTHTDRRLAWLEMAPGQQLHLLEIAEYESHRFDNEFGRHTALFHPGHDYEALQARLKARGVKVEPAERPTPFPRFFFRDAAGHVWEIIHGDRYLDETRS